eukprot:scaffold161661_cov32-Tisochrysis_lutea.AAC.1
MARNSAAVCRPFPFPFDGTPSPQPPAPGPGLQGIYIYVYSVYTPEPNIVYCTQGAEAVYTVHTQERAAMAAGPRRPARAPARGSSPNNDCQLQLPPMGKL